MTDSSSQSEQNIAFELILRPHLKYLFKISYRFTGNKSDAEDLVQDLLVKLYPKMDELRDVQQMRPWLLRVLYRQFIDNTRKQKHSPLRLVSRPLNKEKESSNDQIVDTAPSPEKNMENSFLSEQIEKALNKLSKDQRAVITLHDIEGYQLTELEVLLEVPLGTLKSRLHRARAKLRENLKKMEPFLNNSRLHN